VMLRAVWRGTDDLVSRGRVRSVVWLVQKRSGRRRDGSEGYEVRVLETKSLLETVPGTPRIYFRAFDVCE
jgi:hypothetical protein